MSAAKLLVYKSMVQYKICWVCLLQLIKIQFDALQYRQDMLVTTKYSARESDAPQDR